MNIQPILADQELWSEFCIAYAMAARLRPQVQFRLAILQSPHTHIWEECVWSELQSGNLIDAMSGFISDDLRKG